MREKILRITQDVLNLDISSIEKIAATLLTVFILWLVRKIIIKIVFKKNSDPKRIYQWRKTSSYITIFLGIFIIARIWFTGFQSIATFLGLVSAGIAIALKDVLTNLAGWLFLIIRKPFILGDRIEIDQIKGDVIDIRPFMFSLMELGNWVDSDQSTGRVVDIPNGFVLYKNIANYSKGFQYIWNEINVVVTFKSDWKKAKQILNDIIYSYHHSMDLTIYQNIKKASQKFLIYYPKITPIIYTRVIDIGIKFSVRYLCEPKKRRSSEDYLWETILDSFSKTNTIDFAFPSFSIYKEN